MRPLPHLAIAIILVTALSGCIGSDPTSLEPADTPEATPLAPKTDRFEGEFLAAGLGDPQSFQVRVPEGATEIAALLTWASRNAQLEFRLIDPSGEEAASGWGESETHRYVTTTRPVVPGDWKVEVRSATGIDVHYALEVTSRVATPFGPIDATFDVPVRNAARDLPPEARAQAYPLLPRDYAEVNLNMEPGQGFDFTWSSDVPVYFNVHFHGENGTERPIEERGTGSVGNFSATKTEVYALLWRNEGDQPAKVVLQMDGTYRLHSMTRDKPSS